MYGLCGPLSNSIIPWTSSYFDLPHHLLPGQDRLKKFPTPGSEGPAFPGGVLGGGGGGGQ